MDLSCEKTDRFTCFVRQYPPNWNIPEMHGELPFLATFNFRWPTPSESNELEGLRWWITFPSLYKKVLELPQFPICPATIVTSNPRRQLWIQIDYNWTEYAPSSYATVQQFPGFIVEKVSHLQEPRASDVDVLRELVQKLFYLSYGRVKQTPFPASAFELTSSEKVAKLIEETPNIKRQTKSLTQACGKLEGQLFKISRRNFSIKERYTDILPKRNATHAQIDSYERRLDKLEKDFEAEKYNYLTRNSHEHEECMDSLSALKISMEEMHSGLNEVKEQANQLNDMAKELAELDHLVPQSVDCEVDDN